MGPLSDNTGNGPCGINDALMNTKVFFLKEILSNPIIIQGTTINWENIGGNRGVLVLDPSNPADAKFIPDLSKYSAKGVGGVVQLTEAEYTEKKSHPISTPSSRPKEMLRARAVPGARPIRTPGAEAMAAVAAPVESPAAAPVPTAQVPATQDSADASPPVEAFRPQTRRISRHKAAALP